MLGRCAYYGIFGIWLTGSLPYMSHSIHGAVPLEEQRKQWEAAAANGSSSGGGGDSISTEGTEEEEEPTSSTSSGNSSVRVAQVLLGHLASYAGMGRAKIECIAGCACEPMTLDGHWKKNASLQVRGVVGAWRLAGWWLRAPAQLALPLTA